MLRGYAWSPSYGWINFDDFGVCAPPAIDLKSGLFSGYAWNASMGWISFSNVQGYVQTTNFVAGTDTDANSIPDAWELTYTNVIGVLGASSGTDSDGDGETDRQEYLAGSNPLDASSRLRITAVDTGSGTNRLTWICSPSRVYRVETNSCLTTGSWGPSDLGWIVTNSTSNAVVSLNLDAMLTNCYYRVRVSLPPAR